MKVRDGGRRWCSCGLPAGVRVEKVERADARGSALFQKQSRCSGQSAQRVPSEPGLTAESAMLAHSTGRSQRRKDEQ